MKQSKLFMIVAASSMMLAAPSIALAASHYKSGIVSVAQAQAAKGVEGSQTLYVCNYTNSPNISVGTQNIFVTFAVVGQTYETTPGNCAYVSNNIPFSTATTIAIPNWGSVTPTFYSGQQWNVYYRNNTYTYQQG